MSGRWLLGRITGIVGHQTRHAIQGDLSSVFTTFFNIAIHLGFHHWLHLLGLVHKFYLVQIGQDKMILDMIVSSELFRHFR